MVPVDVDCVAQCRDDDGLEQIQMVADEVPH